MSKFEIEKARCRDRRSRCQKDLGREDHAIRVSERVRERERQTDRQTDREKGKLRDNIVFAVYSILSNSIIELFSFFFDEYSYSMSFFLSLADLVTLPAAKPECTEGIVTTDKGLDLSSCTGVICLSSRLISPSRTSQAVHPQS